MHRFQPMRMPAPPVHYCHQCQISVPDDEVIKTAEGKAAGIAVGLLAGAATKNLLVALAGAFLGALAGHLVDEAVGKKCPWCGALVETLVDSAFGI